MGFDNKHIAWRGSRWILHTALLFLMSSDHGCHCVILSSGINNVEYCTWVSLDFKYKKGKKGVYTVMFNIIHSVFIVMFYIETCLKSLSVSCHQVYWKKFSFNGKLNCPKSAHLLELCRIVLLDLPAACKSKCKSFLWCKILFIINFLTGTMVQPQHTPPALNPQRLILMRPDKG